MTTKSFFDIFLCMRREPLLSFGLTNLEAIVYLATLKHSNTTAVVLAKETSLPKTTIYDQLKNLVAKNLILTYIKKGKKHFTVNDPQIFLEQNTKRQNELKEYIPELRAQYLSKKKDRPRVRTYDTDRGIEVVLKELISEERNELLVLGSLTKEYELFAENKKLEKIIEDRVKHRFKARHIVDDSQLARTTQANDPNELRTTKIIVPNEPFTSVQYIWTNKVVIISPSNPVTITIIEDHEVYKLQKNLFESLWKNHPEKPGTKKVV